MNKCLLDTDILSEIIKGRDLVVAAKARAYLTQLGRFTTSAVSVAEIIYGFRRIGREDRVSQFEASLTLSVSRTTSKRRAAGLRQRPCRPSAKRRVERARSGGHPDRFSYGDFDVPGALTATLSIRLFQGPGALRWSSSALERHGSHGAGAV
jgi:predicted nucleic acid-binding protein